MTRANEALGNSNRELEQFAYVASHDLQEPLRKISSYCQLLLEEEGDNLSDDGREYVDVAIRGAERLRHLVRDLLQFSRITSRGKELENVCTNNCVQEAIDNLAMVIQETGAKITTFSFPDVIADRSHLTLLFQNLISNALKYRSDQTPCIEIGGQAHGNQFEFFVRDNGIGIDPQFYGRIFQVFQRLHNRDEYSGTGIGLALCKRIVNRLGGAIRVESVPDEGSTFFFTVNISPQEDSHYEHGDHIPVSLSAN